MKYLPHIIGLLAVVCSCNYKNKSNCTDHTQLIELPNAGKLKIKLDDKTSEGITTLYSFKQGGDYYTYNFIDHSSTTQPNTINIFNLTQKKQMPSVSFDQEGANAYYPLVNAYMHNLDSIFVVSEYPLGFFLSDARGKQVNKWIPKDFSYANGWWDVFPPYFSDNKLWFYHISTEYFMPDDPEDFFDTPFIGQYDLNENELKFTVGQYPFIYINLSKNGSYYPWLNRPSVVFSNNMAYVSFPKSEQIAVYKEGRLTKHFCASAPSIYNYDEGLRLDDINVQHQINYNATTARYTTLLVHPTLNLIIRVLKQEQPVKNVEGRLNQVLDAKASLLFFSKKGEPYGYVTLEKMKYNYFNIIFKGDQLLISTDNPNNPTNDEDYIEYDTFNLFDFSFHNKL